MLAHITRLLIPHALCCLPLVLLPQTAALVSKTEARSEVIRGKLEEKERERSAKKVQNDAEFQKARIS